MEMILYGMIPSGDFNNVCKFFYIPELINRSKSESLSNSRRIKKLLLSNSKDPMLRDLFRYTNNHITLVNNLMTNLGFPLVGRNHDADKWDSDMIESYKNHFHNPHKTPEMDEEFRRLSNIHLHRNAHHPQKWLGEKRQMDIVSWMEMLCDWISAGVNTKPSPRDYNRSDTIEYYYKHNGSLLNHMPEIKLATEEYLNKYNDGMNFSRNDLMKIYERYFINHIGESK